MLIIMKHVVGVLPVTEKYDLGSQIRRSCKAIPRLISEGYAKKHQKAGFQKYLYDALGECNELIVSLEQVKDIYNIKAELIKTLVKEYDKSGRQIYNLANKWKSFS